MNSNKHVIQDDTKTNAQQKTPFRFKAKPGTYEAMLEAAAFARKAKLKNSARA